MKRVVIIGAGPAGITTAYELLMRAGEARAPSATSREMPAGAASPVTPDTGGFEVTLLEEGADFGGISKTVNVNGNRMDIGGHRFFSKDSRVTDWWAGFLKPQGKPPEGADPRIEDRVMLDRERVSRIYYKKAFFDYPVTLNGNTLRNMGFFTAVRAGFSYMATLFKKLPEDNLENFYINRFGRRLYAMFFEGYTEKLWGRHPRDISAEWGAQRVKGLSVRKVLADVLSKMLRLKHRKVETSLIERFSYPKYGPGQLWTIAAQEVLRLGGTVLTSRKAVRVLRDDSGRVCAVACSDGSEFPCDELVSSMPLKDLIGAMDAAPDNVKRVAKGLPYRDFQTVGVLIPADKFLLRNKSKDRTDSGITPDCWIYVQDTSVKLGRIQVFNNWSPYMVAANGEAVWIGLEYFCAEGDETWEMSDEDYISFAVAELVEVGVIKSTSDVIATHRERVKKAYPAYFDTYAEFGILRGFLDAVPNLYCVGRNGQHRYNNMDHSMVTAFEAVECIMTGNPDKSRIWDVNTESEYHEEK